MVFILGVTLCLLVFLYVTYGATVGATEKRTLLYLIIVKQKESKSLMSKIRIFHSVIE